MIIKMHTSSSRQKVKLNLGGGETVIKGFYNFDVLYFREVDVVCDLQQSIPVRSDSVDAIYAFGVLEHLDDTVRVMEEIYRVCKNGAMVLIKVPYFKSIGAFKDPTHKRFFTEETFYYFDPAERRKRNLPEYNIKANFKVVNIAYYWSKWVGPLPFKNILMKYLWNIARTMYCELKVIK